MNRKIKNQKIKRISLRELRRGDEEWTSVSRGAKVLGVSAQSLYQWIDSGDLTARSFFGWVLVDMREVKRIKRRRTINEKKNEGART